MSLPPIQGTKAELEADTTWSVVVDGLTWQSGLTRKEAEVAAAGRQMAWIEPDTKLQSTNAL